MDTLFDIKYDVLPEIVKLGREFPRARLEVHGLDLQDGYGPKSDGDNEGWGKFLKEVQELETHIISSWKSA